MSTSLRKIEKHGIEPGKEIIRRSPEAHALGAKQARAELHRPSPRRALEHIPSEETRRRADEADRAAADRLATARKLLPTDRDKVRNRQDFMPALSAINQALHGAQRDIGTAIHSEVNDGIDAVARQLDAELVWVAERDACVHCLAYAGERIRPGQSFPIGLTFGETPIKPWPDAKFLAGPPLHPWCRCRKTVWLGSSGPDGLIELPEVLAHEARRSIVKGFALPSESVAVRARAADKLLHQGAGLPKTVEAAARRKLRAGWFTTGPVPDGTTTER